VPASLLQLLLLLIGLHKSLMEGVTYDLYVFKGSREHIVRDMRFIGTGVFSSVTRTRAAGGAVAWMMKPDVRRRMSMERSA
jgi:hypothetical protein